MIPYEQGETLNYIILGDVRSPGVVILSGHDRVHTWDVKDAKGAAGATSALVGLPIGEFTATFSLAGDTLDDDNSDFARWEDFQALLQTLTPSTGPAKALPVYHPDLARNGFTEVSVRSIGGFVHDGKGGVTVAVKFLEYRPPKPHVTKASEASSTGKPNKPDPNQAAKDELAALTAEAMAP